MLVSLLLLFSFLYLVVNLRPLYHKFLSPSEAASRSSSPSHSPTMPISDNLSSTPSHSHSPSPALFNPNIPNQNPRPRGKTFYRRSSRNASPLPPASSSPNPNPNPNFPNAEAQYTPYNPARTPSLSPDNMNAHASMQAEIASLRAQLADSRAQVGHLQAILASLPPAQPQHQPWMWPHPPMPMPMMPFAGPPQYESPLPSPYATYPQQPYPQQQQQHSPAPAMLAPTPQRALAGQALLGAILRRPGVYGASASPPRMQGDAALHLGVYSPAPYSHTQPQPLPAPQQQQQLRAPTPPQLTSLPLGASFSVPSFSFPPSLPSSSSASSDTLNEDEQLPDEGGSGSGAAPRGRSMTLHTSLPREQIVGVEEGGVGGWPLGD